MLLHDLIIDAAKTRGQHVAIKHGAHALDYSSFENQVRRIAAAFTAIGIRPGDRVAVYLSKRFETVIAYFAASYAGAVFVPVNPSLKPAQVGHILNDCNVVTLLTTPTQLDGLSGVLKECARLRHVVTVGDAPETAASVATTIWSSLLETSPLEQPVTRIDTDVAAIFYTSGSTGKPKGVVLSHRNFVEGAVSVAEYLCNDGNDTILAVLPFSFDAGFSQLTTAFSKAATVVLMDYLLPRDVIKAVARYNATGLAGVPPLWTQLARLEWPDEAVTSLRYISNTGGAMPTKVLDQLRQRLPQTDVYLMYGLTEAFRSTYLPPSELDRRPTSIGKAIPNAEILVVDEHGKSCPPGVPGELVHRGALVALGYWNDPEKTARRFRPAPGQLAELPITEIAVWSGDTVVKDEDGFLFFVGRKDDMIKSSGYRISPTEVEEVIYSTGHVRECAALGIPHDDLGQAVVVVCFADQAGESTRGALIEACRARLPNYMVPSEIIFREALPRNPNGKIDRKQIGTELAGLFDEQ